MAQRLLDLQTQTACVNAGPSKDGYSSKLPCPTKLQTSTGGAITLNAKLHGGRQLASLAVSFDGAWRNHLHGAHRCFYDRVIFVHVESRKKDTTCITSSQSGSPCM